jgi:HPt (histidine-containing phosphotransfer) domain-containing protein
MADALTKTVDGKPLPAEKFAYVGDAKDISTWHLPIDDDHIESALKMFGHEKNVPEAKKAAVARKIEAEAKKHNLDTENFHKTYLSSVEHGEAPRPWMEIFRAGDYSKAGKGVITAADLSRVVRNYDPTYHEAPETLGHRADDQPAYGWIDALAVDGDKLLARERQVDPKFEEARRAGKFKKRSAAFYCDENGQVTGLRHLAWLGAGIPEVKGLQDVAFNDHAQKFIEVDFGEEEAVAEKSVPDQIKEGIKTFFAEMFSSSAQPKTFSEDDAKRIATEAATAAAAPLQEKITSLEGELKAQTTKFAERETAIAGGEVKQRAVDAVNRLKGAGKWIPAFEKMGLGPLFEELAKSTATVEFGEGDAKKKLTTLETLVLFLEGLPKIVPGGRVVEGAAHTGKGKASSGDPLTDAARARQKDKNISFGEALAQIAEEQPELTVAGNATGGAV